MKTYLRVPWLIALAVGVLCSGLFIVPGCVTGDNGRPVISPVVTKLAVQFAVMKVLENNPSYALRVAEIARQVRDVAGGEVSTTVAALDVFVRSQIKWEKLSPADRMVVEALLLELKSQLTQRLGSGVLDKEKLLKVAEVTEWIEAAALFSVVRA